MSTTVSSQELMAVQLMATVVVIFLVLYLAHKIRRIHFMHFQVLDEFRRIRETDLINLHQQLQDLDTLYAELQLETGLPPTRGGCASPDFLLLLSRHIRKSEPVHVIECGSGTSTVVLARCLQLNGHGHVHSLEHDTAYAEHTKIELKRLGLSEWATVITAPLSPLELSHDSWHWYSADGLPNIEFDMLVVDGPPRTIGRLARYPALPVLASKLAEGAIIWVDDAERDDEQQMIARWLEEFPDFKVKHYACEKGCASLQLTAKNQK